MHQQLLQLVAVKLVGVHSSWSLDFRAEEEPESVFSVRAGAGAGVSIKVCAGASQNL